jgi:hypothetical protein
MAEFRVPRVVREIAEKGRINLVDVAEVRHAVSPNGEIDQAGAELLIWLNHNCRFVAEAWTEFFAQSLSRYFVLVMEPPGYVDPAGAERLAGAILRGGRIVSRPEMELLARVVAMADHVPECLILYALAELRLSAIEGRGAMRSRGEAAPGTVTVAEVGLLNAMLGGRLAGAGMRITRAEAELLFDLNRAIDGEEPAAWSELFVAAMANYATGAVHVKAPSTTEPHQLRRLNPYAALDEVDLDRAFAEEEARWLAGRMRRYWALDANERALLNHLRRASAVVPVSLKYLIERVA